MQDVLAVTDQSRIPELNRYQCGSYTMHSLEEAKFIARTVLESQISINYNNDLKLDESLLQH